ncbi:hypothetical protein NECAME_17385 [Necator americanus]|uniref:Reverse transcriptase domain-containing protein n=1 Tax=Necator americanus TaxID=51031 RepID=W2TRJ6_NECAM|nr:hypothetical protein NECAME_17385 [Necator americanus]ETN83662.1 hypothetical protein NECAME_17385 [Necator americanus]
MDQIDPSKMKSNEATGSDDILADVWKLLGDRGSNGRTPDVWQNSVTVPVWKGKGGVADCASYRPIRLLCHTTKCGFAKDCSTIDAIHAVRILLEKHREKNRSVHLAFLGLEEAFDRVPNEL